MNTQVGEKEDHGEELKREGKGKAIL